MRIALINPSLYQSATRRLGTIVENLFYNSAPLGLCYLASVLENEKHEVIIIDAPAEGLSSASIIGRIADYSPDIIGITTFTVSVYSAYELAKEIKIKFPEIKIVAGGPHITSNYSDLLENREIDIAVIGEGEITFKELVETIEEGQNIDRVKGIVYRVNEELVFTSPREFIANLDILPFPARHLVPIKLYKPQPNDQKRLPKLSMISSRGCPYSCIFCDKSVFGNFYRSFSPEYIVKEMAHLVREYRAKDIAFVDSTFTPSKNRVYEIIKEIKKSNLGVTWTCSVRADIVDQQILREMKNSGCWRVRIGVESGNEEVLKFIKKGITKAMVRKVTNWAYELDLQPKGFFMVGHFNDTKQTIEETIKFACSIPLKDITVQMNTPLKNTSQWYLIEEFGELITQDLSKYSFWEPVFCPKGLKREDLIYYYRKFYFKFYLRPIIWYRHIMKIRSISDIKKYLRGIKILLFFIKLWMKETF